MKTPDRATVSRLEELPNIGPAIARKLRLIDIHYPKQLIGKDAMALHQQLNRATGRRHDACLMDVLMSAIDYMEGGQARPWWTFTPRRKKLMQRD